MPRLDQAIKFIKTNEIKSRPYDCHINFPEAVIPTPSIQKASEENSKIIQETISNPTFLIMGQRLSADAFYHLFLKLSKLDNSSSRFYLYLLKKTELGSKTNVPLSRETVQMEARLSPRQYTDARATLHQNGMIRWVKGSPKSGQTRVSNFFSINLSCFQNENSENNFH